MRYLPISALILMISCFAPVQAAGLRAGAAVSDITPGLGENIVGGFQPFPGKDIHDELKARCIVLDDGQTKLAMIVCDLLGFHRSVSVEARRLIFAQSGIRPENVLISATHTHSATSALGLAGYRTELQLDEYQKFVARRIADGVQRAVNALRPAQIGFGQVDVPEHVFNRRWFMKDGTAPPNPFGKVDRVKMNPPAGSPNLVEPAGPIDPAVSFVALREPSGKPIAIYSAYSLHYVGGVGNADISADYYGMYCEMLKKKMSAGDENSRFVAAMANGTSGDINNINFKSPRPSKPAYAQMQYVAGDVATKVAEAFTKLEWSDSAALAAKYQEIDVAWRTIGPDLLAWAKETEAKGKAGKNNDVIAQSYAARVQRLAEASGPARMPVQVLKIGDICIGSSPCETFAETGLEFKKRSPVAKSFMVELSHAYLGYLPTPRHFELGGYETWPGTNYLEPQASVRMMDALLEMTRELQSRK
ncbi:MAG: neutral/alkaline non-lysosomal ceramidase N-terminal domain-containing protein [bacterium]